MRVVETAAALLVGTAAAITPSIALAPTASADCPDIEVIFARGTDDTPGLGAVGGAFVSASVSYTHLTLPTILRV